MSDNPSKTTAGRARRPMDRRDEAVGATLVGLVVVLLGYASGIGTDATGTTTAAGGPAPSAGGSSGTSMSLAPPVLIQASPSTSATSAAGGDRHPVPGDDTGPVGPYPSSAPSTAPGATTGPGPSSPPPSTPPPASAPMPTSTPTGPVVIGGPPAPTSTGPGSSEPSSPGGPPSTSPPTVISADPTTSLPSNLLPCVLEPVTAPLGGLLGLGGVLGSTCPTPSAGTP